MRQAKSVPAQHGLRRRFSALQIHLDLHWTLQHCVHGCRDRVTLGGDHARNMAMRGPVLQVGYEDLSVAEVKRIHGLAADPDTLEGCTAKHGSLDHLASQWRMRMGVQPG